jgi:hypothetical protein
MEVTESTGQLLNHILTGHTFGSVPVSHEGQAVNEPGQHSGQAQRPRHPLHPPHSHRHLDEMGDWPQRLLHAPTMTSHTW